MIVIAGTTLAIIGLTFAGVQHPWSSAAVLAPLIIGLLLIAAFILYEKKYPLQPTIPWEVVSHRISLVSYISTFLHGIVAISTTCKSSAFLNRVVSQLYFIIVYMPIFFQAALGASPLHGSVDGLPQTALTAPSALAGGLIVQKMGRYVPINYVGSSIMIVGLGVMSLYTAHVTEGQLLGYQVLESVGIGVQVTIFYFVEWSSLFKTLYSILQRSSECSHHIPQTGQPPPSPSSLLFEPSAKPGA